MFALILLAFAAHAGGSRCGSAHAPIQKSQMSCLVHELITTKFPELNQILREKRIALREFDSDEFFLKTSIQRSNKQWNYLIDVNPVIFKPQQKPSGPPSLLAVQGILAHELFHLVDYHQVLKQKSIKPAIDWLFSESQYERSTDEKAFLRGFALGIKRYRIWIYGKLDPVQLARKRKTYYTPEEIDRWLANNRSDVRR